MTKVLVAKNPNQQLLDYAVKNIKEWPSKYPHLRADSSSKSLFFSAGDDWSIGNNYWGNDYPTYRAVNGTLGEVTPQVITKDEWLAEIKRRQEEKPMNKPLERYKEYDVKLTGEEIAFLWYCTSNTSANVEGVYGLHTKMVKLFSACKRTRNILSSNVLIREGDSDYSFLMKEFFKSPETEEQRHLRELKEQYEALGEKIKQMEK